MTDSDFDKAFDELFKKYWMVAVERKKLQEKAEESQQKLDKHKGEVDALEKLLESAKERYNVEEQILKKLVEDIEKETEESNRILAEMHNL